MPPPPIQNPLPHDERRYHLLDYEQTLSLVLLLNPVGAKARNLEMHVRSEGEFVKCGLHIWFFLARDITKDKSWHNAHIREYLAGRIAPWAVLIYCKTEQI